MEVAVTGVTAGTHDFNAQMRERLPYVFLFVLGLASVLLLLTFRSLVIAATAIALNLLSVGAAYGILVAVFQHGWLADVFGFQTNGAIVSWLPLFLFVVLFGLSMDYHVFILSRIKEPTTRRRATTEAPCGSAITRTAGTVTSAAIIMVAVFGLFASLSLIMLQQMGFGLAVAVLIDATSSASVLVPVDDAAAGRVELVPPAAGSSGCRRCRRSRARRPRQGASDRCRLAPTRRLDRGRSRPRSELHRVRAVPACGLSASCTRSCRGRGRRPQARAWVTTMGRPDARRTA